MADESEPSVDPAFAIQALERFITENDELTRLESRIGRFNIFQALRIERTELRHSNFLAWLLNPTESHGAGGLFLRTLLLDLMRRAGPSRPISPILLERAEFRGTEVLREWKNIDLVIACHQPPVVVVIENKIDAGHYNDLARYAATVRERFHDLKPLFVFLTLEGDDSPHPEWLAYGYADVARVLSRCRELNTAEMGVDVAMFVDHYLSLLRSRTMTDQDDELRELCQKIYQNHRLAIDLINEYATGPESELLEVAAARIRANPRWRLLKIKSSTLQAGYVPWISILPKIDMEGWAPPWIRLELRIRRNQVSARIRAIGTNDIVLRRRIIERLVADPKEFGFKTPFKEFNDERTLLASDYLLRWKDDTTPDTSRFAELVDRKLEDFERRLDKATDVVVQMTGSHQSS
jgi:hypothetical protein